VQPMSERKICSHLDQVEVAEVPARAEVLGYA
jgi:hypothetical protein